MPVPWRIGNFLSQCLCQAIKYNYFLPFVSLAPCQPQDLRTSAECDSDVLTSTWDLADGALSYEVEAFGNTNGSSRYNCSSFTNSCAIPGVPCGESLTTYITAFDDECSSERILGEVAETGKDCQPFNLIINQFYCQSITHS